MGFRVLEQSGTFFLSLGNPRFQMEYKNKILMSRSAPVERVRSTAAEISSYVQKDCRLGRDFYYWICKNRKIVSDFTFYCIFQDGDLHVMYSRRSGNIVAWFPGYGYDQMQVQIRDLEDMTDILEFIERARDIQIVKSLTAHGSDWYESRMG